MAGLFGSTILEVILGLSFVYFLLSLVCSSINEMLAGFLKLRAKDLDKAIRNLICDDQLAVKVLNHPLIEAMGSTRAETKPVQVGAGQGQPSPDQVEAGPGAVPADQETAQHATSSKGLFGSLVAKITGNRGDFTGKPSYIPSRTFSLALIDAITDPAGSALTAGDVKRAVADLAGDLGKNVVDLEPTERIGRALFSLINENPDPKSLALSLDEARDIVNRLSDPSLDDATKQSIVGAETFNDLRRSIERLPEGLARTRLLGALDEGRAGLEQAYQSIEAWFDHAMERTSGVYKRRAQSWLLSIAFLVTILLGVDTLQLYDSLASNPSLRSAVAQQAEQATGPGGAFVLATPTPADQAAATPVPNGQPEAPVPPTAGQVYQELQDTSLPFGYDDQPAPDPNESRWSNSEWWRWLAGKIPGLLITTFAVALGSPFWFDVLNRVSNIRAAGKPPATTTGQ
jgi:hypothetical protein